MNAGVWNIFYFCFFLSFFFLLPIVNLSHTIRRDVVTKSSFFSSVLCRRVVLSLSFFFFFFVFFFLQEQQKQATAIYSKATESSRLTDEQRTNYVNDSKRTKLQSSTFPLAFFFLSPLHSISPSRA